GVSVRHIFKPISYLEIQLLSGVSGGYIRTPVAGTPVPAIFVVIASMTYPEDRRCFGMHKESYCEK
ncbi:TPA: hypothetical protein ACMUVD_004987, partial [Enterobacter kobei]